MKKKIAELKAIARRELPERPGYRWRRLKAGTTTKEDDRCVGDCGVTWPTLGPGRKLKTWDVGGRAGIIFYRSYKV